MFLDVEQFPFAPTLAARWRQLRDEAAALDDGHWLPWTPFASCDGDWHIAPLHASIEGVPLSHVVDLLPHVARRCPLTMAALKGVDGLTGAAFSRLAPGTHVHAHRDHPGFAGLVRGHLGLDVPDGGLLRCRGQAQAWREGRWLFFDTQHEHEAVNLSDAPRTVLLLDVAGPSHEGLWISH